MTKKLRLRVAGIAIPILLFIFLGIENSQAQDSLRFHEGRFRRGGFGMSSKGYKPDPWEVEYFKTALKSVFPADLLNAKDKFDNKLLLLLGVVDSVTVTTEGDSAMIGFRVENKYWDFTEDHSIQDEVMFVSPKGGGPFYASIKLPVSSKVTEIRHFPFEKKFVFVYGTLQDLSNGIPVIAAQQIKWIDYFWYSLNIFSYDVARDKDGQVLADKKNGIPKFTDFHFFTIAHKGQNK
ncbi:MAG TPA: hypothetical protein VE035_02825 [Puia sp.]|nr:hypothetical protein [Puia sp.]